MAVNQTVTSLRINVVLDDRPPLINISEKELTRKERTTLAQLRSRHYMLLGSYNSRISKDAKDASLDVYADCSKTPQDVKHIFNFPAHLTTMDRRSYGTDQWTQSGNSTISMQEY